MKGYCWHLSTRITCVYSPRPPHQWPQYPTLWESEISEMKCPIILTIHGEFFTCSHSLKMSDYHQLRNCACLNCKRLKITAHSNTKNTFLTPGTVWWFTNRDTWEEPAAWSRRLQNTLYRWMGRSDTGASQVSCPRNVSFCLSTDTTASFCGWPGAFGAVRNNTMNILQCVLTRTATDVKFSAWENGIQPTHSRNRQ